MSNLKLILKICIYALIAFTFSKLFCDMSILVIISIFFSLCWNDITSRESFIKMRKRSFIITGIFAVSSFIGIILIIVGEKILNQDSVVILGTFIFAPTFTCSFTVGFFALIRKLEMKNKKEKIL